MSTSKNAVKADLRITEQRDVYQGGPDRPRGAGPGNGAAPAAQSLADQAARKAELEKAEKTFLAVGNAAGESDEYQLNLGKVYYWLGKQDEGRKLFDAILARNAKNFAIRIALAQILREVGAEGESRKLAEKIYEGESDAENKSSAASLRSLMAQGGRRDSVAVAVPPIGS